MVNAVSILGSTGSIGTQALEICDSLGIRVLALTAGSNLGRIEKQIRKFNPEMVSVLTSDHANHLKNRLSDYKRPLKIMSGRDGNLAAAVWPGSQIVIAAMVGVAGLEPILASVESGLNVALANKEVLVAGGAIIMPLAKTKGSQILPIDSEHSAIWQCLSGSLPDSMRRIFLTASGGPFRGYSADQLKDITVAQALKHPTWSMGNKITVDSATLMNKGLEVIEACWLFGCSPKQIEVVVHPQSIIHSMVEFRDGSVMAQMGFPDIKVPIQLALTWPDRVINSNMVFDPFDDRTNHLTFERPDTETFKLLALAYQAAEIGGTLPTVLNAANEEAVNLFLHGKLSFPAIAERVEMVMKLHTSDNSMGKIDLSGLLSIDRWARDQVLNSVT